MSLSNYIKRIFIYTLKYAKGGHYKMVLIVRTDVTMGKGKIAAQCAHAAVECCRQVSVSEEYERMFQSWLAQGQPKIALKVPNEEELISLARSARKSGLITSIIKDAGRTQLPSNTISALGIGPGPTEQIDKLTSNLKLL